MFTGKFGSVMIGSPCMLPTTCSLATFVKIPAAFCGFWLTGGNRGRFVVSNRLWKKPQRRGCMKMACGGMCRAPCTCWMALAIAEYTPWMVSAPAGTVRIPAVDRIPRMVPLVPVPAMT
jgi:hypothetical protein